MLAVEEGIAAHEQRDTVVVADNAAARDLFLAGEIEPGDIVEEKIARIRRELTR